MADKCEQGKAEAEEEKRRWLGNFDGDADGVAQAGCVHDSDSVGAEFQNVTPTMIGHEEIAVTVKGEAFGEVDQVAM